MAALTFMAAPTISYADCGPVLLDPGHGGNDPGACAYGLQEKDLTWKITNYCKERLDQLGIPSVLTRGENENPLLSSRCDLINTYNARCMVSFHINAGGGTGAEVWIPHDSPYMQFTNTETSQFGTQLLQKFQNLGLANRGNKTRLINAAYYPDGTNQDYLAMNRLPRYKGTSGALIEHAFIDTYNDAMFMSNDDNLRALGYADAEAIAEQWPNSYIKPDGGDWSEGWKHNDRGWWYRYADGSYPANCWAWIGSAWYHFDAEGYMQTGWFWDNGYYWLGDENDGSMHANGWTWCNWAWYWLEENGLMRGEGWFFHNNTWYWINAGGDMAIGWVWIGEAWYYFNEYGTMLTGWFTDASGWHYADDSGAVYHNGWAWIGDAWYYLNSDCSMHIGWLADTYWYYLDPTSGRICVGWVWVDDAYYYLDEAGHMLTGWFFDGASWYWLDASGRMAMRGAAYTSSGYNLFDDSGRWLAGSGWFVANNHWYYLQDSNVQTGWQWVGSAWYFLYGSGEMATGPITVDGIQYFLDKNTGAMFHNCWVTADGDWCDPSDPARMYYLNDAGRIVTGDATPVMGDSTLPYDVFITNFANKIQPHYPSIYAEKGAATPTDFARATWDEAYAEGVNPVVLAAQIGVETGWLSFGGAVPDWACNFGGIGAIDSDPQKYAIFENVQQGLLAQVQHLKAYASTAPLNQPCVDPRFQYVTRGCAPYVQNFGNGIWASDPAYASKLINAMAAIG